MVSLQSHTRMAIPIFKRGIRGCRPISCRNTAPLLRESLFQGAGKEAQLDSQIVEKTVIVYPGESCEGFCKLSNTFLVDYCIIVPNNPMLEIMHCCYVHVSSHKTI